YRRRGRNVRAGMLLARPRWRHLEPQDYGRPRSGARDAQLLPCARKAAQLESRRGGKRDRSQWRYRMLDLVRDRCRTRIWPDPSAERPDLDAFDNDGRTEGSRGKGVLYPAART